MDKSKRKSFFGCFLFILYCFSSICYATDSITPGELIRDGQTVISQGQTFELGFFSPGNSTFRYVGIWYYEISIPTVIWVANREQPINGNNSVLTIANDGNLVVLDGNRNMVWSSNVSLSSNNTTGRLMDSGNLVLMTGGNSSNASVTLWDTFSNPTDTFLPGMRIYVNSSAGENRPFSSWRNANDPSRGRYSMGVDPLGSPQLVIWDGENRHWRTGHWNGLIFTGIPEMRTTYLYGFRLDRDERDEQFFTYTPSNSASIIKFMINSNGNEEQVSWDEGRNEWSMIQSQPSSPCDIYNTCGAFGICDTRGSPICTCLRGFEPSNWDEWNQGIWSSGCVRKVELECQRNTSSIEESGGGDGFFRVGGVKLPDFLDSVGSQNIGDCETKCLSDCSCKAYTCITGINCMIWTRDLVDIQQFEDGGNNLFIRLNNSELGNKRRLTTLVIIVIVVLGTVFLLVSIFLLWRFKAIVNSWRKNDVIPILDASRSIDSSTDYSGPDNFSVDGKQGTGTELALLNFNSVAAATNNFSDENKLGQGGFGPVYKGMLPGGEEIAVKRLSRKSGQGVEEFKNEITLIAKLQHRNLVRLLGCCVEGEEKLLVYEYMKNKSLDSYIFDSDKQALLDWRKRFAIIEGIARGLLYLHRDSRLRIIHRDLKASNILLDEEMNPKISDFGMARIFGGNQNEANTNRIVGTYGYMSPEYAMEGLFSVKSDVYSFGVLLLEIISGRKNTSFRSPEYSNIIGYAWDLWDSGKAMELIDPSIVRSCYESEVLKCIHIGMLCVQDMAAHRPTMASVVLMLESEITNLPMARQPTFTSVRKSIDTDSWNDSHGAVSSNNVTMSVIVGR